MTFYDWFKIDILYKITSGIEQEELSELDAIRLRNEGLLNGDEYEKGEAYINLGLNPIKSIEPRCFVPKGKQNKKYFTEVIFDDGTAVNADYKPIELYSILKEYYEKLPEPTDQSESNAHEQN
jgi:hypothetical protein